MSAPSVCFITSELVPFAKTGGLADVSSALPKYLHELGHDVRVFLPLYSVIDRDRHPLEPVAGLQDVPVPIGRGVLGFSLFETVLPETGVPVYFVDCPALYSRPGLYTDDRDEHLRFVFLCLATLATCRRTGWAPDVVHCNDWQSGLMPVFLKNSEDPIFRNTRTLLTIHNLGYQGIFPASVLEDAGLAAGDHYLPREDLEAGRIGFLKTGLMNADFITTVSPTYAEEIQTEALGMGLHEILRRRTDKLRGILNGIDSAQWNPRTDPALEFRYSSKSLWRKEKNKEALLGTLELPYRKRVPTFGIVSRLTVQKGFELLDGSLTNLLASEDVRLVVLGSGEVRYERLFEGLQDQHPDKVCFYRGYHEELAHKIEGACDAFLMPSIYEPCGLNQMYSLVYGTVPIVRKTGGLADTVRLFDPQTGEGNGIVFDHPTPEGVRWALRTALELHSDPETWKKLMLNGMAADFSWDRQAQEYSDLYRELRAGEEAKV